MITDIIHPEYELLKNYWRKWRLAYLGGDSFIHAFLKKFSKREGDDDFRERRSITYCPSFAKAAVNDIKNSIFQRTIDVSRKGGPKSYLSAAEGREGGVDLSGSTMNSFIGRKVLPELLTMKRVGVYVDMPPLPNNATLAEKGNIHPYIYMYKTEQIKSWTFDPLRPTSIISLLLEDNEYDIDLETGLTNDFIMSHRLLQLVPDGVKVTKYDTTGSVVNTVILNIPIIPFVILEISDSLLADVANYQIALLNLESSDIFYALKSNFPFYTEQFDTRTQSLYLKQSDEKTPEETEEIAVGMAAGRRYPIGLERPGFIHPSSEPLTASMAKGEQIKRDIRLLVNLAVSNLQPKMASAESKNYDNQSLEAGLSYIGIELESAENQIGALWSLYEGYNQKPTIRYPRSYSLKSEEERTADAKSYEESMAKVPSKTYQKEVAKVIAELRIGHKISAETLDHIKSEIDKAQVVISDPDIIKSDFESGFVGLELASQTRGYPEGEVERAKQDHADRISRIAISQTQGAGAQARGVMDMGTDPNAGKTEKAVSRDTTIDPVPMDHTRGEGQ